MPALQHGGSVTLKKFLHLPDPHFSYLLYKNSNFDFYKVISHIDSILGDRIAPPGQLRYLYQVHARHRKHLLKVH